MDRINGQDWIDISGGRRGFRGQDAVAGIAGTEVTAAWLNGLQEELLFLIERCGLAPDQAVSTLVARAVQSGRLNYADAAGTSNGISIALNPAPAAWADVLNVPIDVRIASTNTAADPTLAVVGVAGTRVIQRRDGTQLQPLDLLGGTVHRLRYDGAVVRLESPAAGENIRAVTSLVLWVRPDGADTNDGTANTPAGALQTINEALARAARVTGPVTVRLGVASTYAPWATPITRAQITILGDVADQDNYILAGLGPVIGAQNIFSCLGGSLVIQGVRLHNTGPSNNTLSCNASGYISADHVTFTAAEASIYTHISSTEASMIYLGAGCRMGGTMQRCMTASLSGQIVQTADLTMLAGAAFGTVARAFSSGGITANPGATFAGSNTGKRFAADLSGVIYTYGAGANFYPGTVAGTADAATGGIYA